MPPIPKRLTCLKHRSASSTKLSTSALSDRSRSGGATSLTCACTPTRYSRVSNINGRISAMDHFNPVRACLEKKIRQLVALGQRSPAGCGVSYQSILGSRIPLRSLPVATVTLGLMNPSKSVWSSWSTTDINACRVRIVRDRLASVERRQGWTTHCFVVIDGDVECCLELRDHIRNAHSLEVYDIRDDEECARVLTWLCRE